MNKRAILKVLSVIGVLLAPNIAVAADPSHEVSANIPSCKREFERARGTEFKGDENPLYADPFSYSIEQEYYDLVYWKYLLYNAPYYASQTLTLASYVGLFYGVYHFAPNLMNHVFVGGAPGLPQAGMNVFSVFYLFKEMYGSPSDLKKSIADKGTAFAEGLRDLYYHGDFFRRTKSFNPLREYLAVEMRYLAHKNQIPKETQTLIENRLHSIEKEISSQSDRLNLSVLGEAKDLGEGGIGKYKMSLAIIMRLMGIPSETKQVDIDAQAKEKLAVLLKEVQPNVREAVNDMVSAISINSKKPRNAQSSRQIFFMLGAPGTGKTRLMSKLANIIGLPLLKMNFAEFKENADFNGPSERWEDLKKFSLLTRAITSAQTNAPTYKNSIIFIDEVDKAFSPEDIYASFSSRTLITQVLELLSQDTKYFPLKDLGTSVDVSSYIFVLAGNKPIASAGGAIMNRMNVIKFGQIEEADRIKIACFEFGKHTKDLRYPAENHQGVDESAFIDVIKMAQLDGTLSVGVRNILSTVSEYAYYMEKKSILGDMKTFPYSEKLVQRAKDSYDPFISFDLLSERFKRIDNTMHPSNQAYIQHRLDDLAIEVLKPKTNGSSNQDGQISVKENIENLTQALKIPSQIRNFSENDEADVFHTLEIGMKYYETSVKEQLFEKVRDFFNSTRLNQDLHELRTEGAPRFIPKQVLYLEGPAGVGKTTFVDRLSRAAGLPIIRISAQDIVTTKDAASLIEHPVAKAFLSEGQQEPYPLNSIIFIDEFDKLYNSKASFEDLQDRILKFIDTQYPQYSIELSKSTLKPIIETSFFLFILAGNDPLRGPTGSGQGQAEKSNPLFSRLTRIVFKSIPLETRQAMMKEFFERSAAAKDIPLTEDELSFVREMVDYEHGVTHEPGVRIIEREVQNYATFLKTKSASKTSHDYNYKNRILPTK